ENGSDDHTVGFFSSHLRYDRRSDRFGKFGRGAGWNQRHSDADWYRLHGDALQGAKAEAGTGPSSDDATAFVSADAPPNDAARRALQFAATDAATNSSAGSTAASAAGLSTSRSAFASADQSAEGAGQCYRRRNQTASMMPA